MGASAQYYSPTHLPMEKANVEWENTVYREVCVDSVPNMGLAADDDTNLLAFIIRLAAEGKIRLYEYALNGNEKMDERHETNIAQVLDSHQIFYHLNDKGLVAVDERDLPVAEQGYYYIKESARYNMANGSFYTHVLAFCPVLVYDNEYGEAVRYPLFWVRYADIEPYLNRFPIYGGAGRGQLITASEYFTRRLYKGEIYKEFTPRGKSLAQTCKTDSAYAAVQARIEGNIQRAKADAYAVDSAAEPVVEVMPKAIQRPHRMRLFRKKK